MYYPSTTSKLSETRGSASRRYLENLPHSRQKLNILPSSSNYTTLSNSNSYYSSKTSPYYSKPIKSPKSSPNLTRRKRIDYDLDKSKSKYDIDRSMSSLNIKDKTYKTDKYSDLKLSSRTKSSDRFCINSSLRNSPYNSSRYTDNSLTLSTSSKTSYGTPIIPGISSGGHSNSKKSSRYKIDNEDLNSSTSRYKISNESSSRYKFDDSNSSLYKSSSRYRSSSRRESIISGSNVGLRNLGNTCFMNSIIQCLSNTTLLKNYILSDKFNTDLKNYSGVATAFKSVLTDLWSSSSTVNPSSLKSQIQKRAPQFSGYSQHDSQELLLALLDGIHEDFNHCNRSKQKYVALDKLCFDDQARESWKQYRLRDDSKLVDIFVGQIVSTLTCVKCGETSTVFESFWDLSVPISSSVHNSLKTFTTAEILDHDEKPKCEKCQTNRKMIKEYRIFRLPKILIIHLKRFKGSGRIRRKDDSNVKIDQNLNVSSFLHEKSTKILGNQQENYKLYAVSNHCGSTGGGHYTAICKSEDSNEWKNYNDSSVSSVNESSIQSSNAYVLFYVIS